MATLGGVRTEESTREYFDINLQHWKDHGFGLWIFRDRKGSFVGRGGLRHMDVDDRDEIEIAYALIESFWGKGLATEIARFSQKIGFEELELSELIGVTTLENIPSKRVMEKIGMTYNKDVMHKDYICALYRQEKDTYLRQCKTLNSTAG